MSESENGDTPSLLRPIVRAIADGGFYSPQSYPSAPADHNPVLACPLGAWVAMRADLMCKTG